MDKFFSPSSIAVIGASNSPFNLGASICSVIEYFKYPCKLYAVNNKGENVQNAKGYKSVLDIEDDVDLAILILNAKHIPSIIEECGKKGIQRVIIESSGFSEEGEEGQDLQNELDEAAKKYNIRYLGPNCLGTFNSSNRFCCFYGLKKGMYDKALESKGSISYIVQSGGVGALVIDEFQEDIVNVDKMVSIGNKADIDESELIEYYDRDPQCEVICMYLESIKDGRKLIESAKKVKKPILAFKVGRTESGVKASLSHTAGMASNDAIFDGACKQAGIIRCDSISEIYSLPKIFTEMPLLKGKKIAIFTNSGAFGGITSDLITESGLEIAQFSSKTKTALKKNGKLYNNENPVDLGPALSVDFFHDVFEILLKDKNVDGVLAIPNVWQDIVIEAMVDMIKLTKKYKKPAAFYIPNSISRIIEIRTKHNIPVFLSPEEAIKALVVSHKHHECLKHKGV